MIGRLVGKIYQRVRGHDLGDLPTSVALHMVLTRIPSVARGVVFDAKSLRATHRKFLGRNVTIHNRRSLSAGPDLVIGEHSFFQCFGGDGIRIGDRVTIGAFSILMASVVLREPGVGISIGNQTSIGVRATIWGQGGVSIGDNCLLGPDVFIVSENHIYERRDVPIAQQGGKRLAVVVGNDCWLGAGVKVMPGVTIGSGSVVGAGSVVTRSLPEFSVAVGSPARVIGLRG